MFFRSERERERERERDRECLPDTQHRRLEGYDIRHRTSSEDVFRVSQNRPRVIYIVHCRVHVFMCAVCGRVYVRE